MCESISLARGIPAADLLPVEELADCARAALRDPAALSYGPAGGFGPLREWVAQRHGVESSRVVLTNGSLQGFVLLARLLLGDERRRVLVEAPTYDRPLGILRELGAEVVPLPLDDEGLDLDALARALGDGPAAFLYTIPTFQNPTGRTLTTDRRRRLVEIARAHELVVFEDDPYGLVRFDGDPSPTLHELAGGDGVVYSSSFSKTVAPGLRVGYLVLPERLAPLLERAAVSTYIAPGFAAQATLAEFLARGRFGPNLRRVRSLLRARRDAMLTALDQHVGEGARFTRPDGGYFVWLELPDGADEDRLLADTAAAGVDIVAGRSFYVAGTAAPPAARLAFSAVSPAEIVLAVQRLAACIPAAAAVV